MPAWPIPSICLPSGLPTVLWYQCHAPPAWINTSCTRNVVQYSCEPVPLQPVRRRIHGDIQWRIPFDTCLNRRPIRFCCISRFNTVQRFFFGNIRFEGNQSTYGGRSLLYTGGVGFGPNKYMINKMTRAMTILFNQRIEVNFH